MLENLFFFFNPNFFSSQDNHSENKVFVKYMNVQLQRIVIVIIITLNNNNKKMTRKKKTMTMKMKKNNNNNHNVFFSY